MASIVVIGIEGTCRPPNCTWQVVIDLLAGLLMNPFA